MFSEKILDEFEEIGRMSRNSQNIPTRRFPLLGTAHPKWWYETDLVEFDPNGAFSFRPDGECRKNEFWTQLDDLRQPGVFRCLVKPTQNGGMKPTSWNSIPRVLFRFAPMGNLDKTSFKPNWTTFVNPEFCAAGKRPPKMVVWNRPRGIRSKGCFFVSPQWGKSKKRIFNAIGRPTSNRRFALLGKSHPKWWYETDLVEFDPKGVFSFHPYGKSPKNEFWTQLDDLRQHGFFRCFQKLSQNGGMIPNSLNSIQGCFFVLPRWGKSKKRVLNAIGRPSSTRLFALLGKAHPKWSYETDLVEFDPKGVFSIRHDGESRKNVFWTLLAGLRQPGFLHCLQKPNQNSNMKPTSWNSIPRVFFRFPPMGKVELTSF